MGIGWANVTAGGDRNTCGAERAQCLDMFQSLQKCKVFKIYAIMLLIGGYSIENI